MIQTNKLNVELNMDAIARDFTIYKVTKDKGSLDDEKTNILDFPTIMFNAMAVQYCYGYSALVLFKKKSGQEKEFCQAMLNEKATVYEITEKDLKNERFCKENFYEGNRLLVQLLLNSIKVPTEEGAYNNLTGKLFYSNTGIKSLDKDTGELKSMSYVEIHLDPGMYLNLSVKTFKRDDFNQKGRRYVFDPNSFCLRKRLQTDNSSLTSYIVKSSKKYHKTIDFLKTGSFASYQKSKMGILAKFLFDVKSYLGEYLTLTFDIIEDGQDYNAENKEYSGMTNEKIKHELASTGVVIVDENHTENSMLLAQIIVDELEKVYDIKAEIGALTKDKYNIRIIRDEEYYAAIKTEDVHNDKALCDYIVQHMNESSYFNYSEKRNNEDDEEGTNSVDISQAIKKITQELLIKKDLKNKQISVFDWKRFSSGKTWTFVTRKTDPDDKNIFYYKVLIVQPDGSLDVDAFVYTESSLDVTETQEAIISEYENFVRTQKGRGQIDGLVFSSIDNVHAIVATAERILPDACFLWNSIRETDLTKPVNKTKLIEAVEAFKTAFADNESFIKHADAVTEKIRNHEGALKNKEVRKIINVRSTAGQTLNRYMHENFGIWIVPEFLHEDFESEYKLRNFKGIKYFNKKDHNGTECMYYYVGSNDSLNLKQGFARTCVVRKIVSAAETLDCEDLLPLLTVEFVRSGQYTVLPFPFKYLREFD